MTKIEKTLLIEKSKDVYRYALEEVTEKTILPQFKTEDEKSAYMTGIVFAIRSLLSEVKGTSANSFKQSDIEYIFDSVNFPEKYEK